MEEKKFTPIDLSKLAPTELPIEMIDIRLNGDIVVDEKTGEKKQNVQRISVHPISGAGMIAWSGNPKNNPNGVTFEERACLTALIYGADIPEDEARILMEYDRKTASEISMAVWIATSEYQRSLRAEAEKAEKNSETAETNTEE